LLMGMVTRRIDLSTMVNQHTNKYRDGTST
jgi:hypothetical protein